MKNSSLKAACIALPLAWFPISTFAAATDYDGGWTGTYNCGAVLTDPSRPEFSNETKLTITNGRVSGEFTRNTKLGKEVENWTGSIDNGNLNVSNPVRRDDGASWTLRFNGSISGNDKFSIGGEMLARTGQKVRDCKLAIVLITPSQASLVEKAKIAEENQARQKLAIESEKKRIVADKEALTAQTRKLEADRTAGLKVQAQIAETNKLQIEQQAKIVADKEAELAAEAQRIEEDKKAASEALLEIEEKNKLLVEQQAKLLAEKEAADKESSDNIQYLLFALGGLLVTGFVIFLAVRRRGAADNKQKEPTVAAVDVKDGTNLAQQERTEATSLAAQSNALALEQINAEKERQELSLREQVATLQKEKDALIAKERVVALEAEKEAALYKAKLANLEQERLSAINRDKEEREKTSEALRIASAEARISTPVATPQSTTEKEKLEDSKSPSSFCMQCGTKLEDKATACSSCGNPVPFTSSLISKKLVDDAKNKLQNFSSQVQGAVVKAAGNISKEAAKVNEQLSKNNGENVTKLENFNLHSKEYSKNVFDNLNKLTKKQKIITVTVLFVSIATSLLFGDDIESDAKKDQALICEGMRLRVGGTNVEQFKIDMADWVKFDKITQNKYAKDGKLIEYKEAVLRERQKGCSFPSAAQILVK